MRRHLPFTAGVLLVSLDARPSMGEPGASTKQWGMT